MSFRAQLVLVITVLLLLFSIAAGWATIATLEGALQDDGLQDVRRTVDSRRDQVTSRLALSRQSATSILESIASSCDQSGQINSACAGEALGDWARREQVRSAVLQFPGSHAIHHGATLAAKPELYRDAHGLNIVVSVKDTWSGGKLTAVFDGGAIEKMLTGAFRPGGTGSVGLLDANGTAVVPVETPPASPETLAVYCSNGAGTGVVRSGSTRILVGASALPTGQGCVVAQLPMRDLLWQPLSRLGVRFTTIAGTFVLMAAALAFVLAHLMSRPLTALTRRVEAMSHGDFDTVVPRGGPQEIRTFADAFARMARSLKRSHEAMQQSEEKLRLSYRAAHLWPWEASLARGYFRWMDFGQEPAVAREEPLEAVLERVHAEDRAAVLRTLHNTEGEGTFQLEFRYSKPDGETIWIASRGERIQRLTGLALIGVNLDVTARRRMEELERERESLSASTRLAAELAHEINNPLAAITGALYLMKNAGPDSSDYARCLEMATEASNRITHIARQLLGLYQRSAGAVPVDVARLVREVLDAYREQLAAQGIRVTANLPAEATLTGQPAELRTAIANVVANALTSIVFDGNIAVRVRQSRDLRLGHDGVRVTVSDNGSGIAPENLHRVFEAFFSTSAQRGTGLGLWVTSNIVRKHYGSIRVRSSQTGARRGTTVSIFLPCLGSGDALRLGPNRAA